MRTRTEEDTKAFIKEKEMERSMKRSTEPGKGTAILTGIVVLFLLGWLVYALVR
ncbi:hypothetical protein OG785_40025 [Streptomyces sp. NBC_00006]|uniref:hypothetical protein n=1 Tax=unclassified Streptomyces TaxID=2593676 RepID=UPI00225014C2|nr:MULTISPECIES: hypothetical protein [unclassified Streptomyces]MCX5536740.1 hypothetical protein [Streptomyces sp. NBC_00006]